MMCERKSGVDCLRARRDELVEMIERTRAKAEAAEAAMVEGDEFQQGMRRRVRERDIRPSLEGLRIDFAGRLHDMRLNAQEVLLEPSPGES